MLSQPNNNNHWAGLGKSPVFPRNLSNLYVKYIKQTHTAMKRLILFTSGLMMIANIWGGNSINNPYEVANINPLSNYSIDNVYYGINLYQASTGSGYSANTNLNFNVQKFNRIFEVGVMFDTQHKQVKGFEFMYKHFLGFRSANYYHKSVKLFLHYNFLYRLPSQVIMDPSYLQSANANPSMTKGKLTTFEHSLGIGAQIALFKQICLEGSAGFGVYFGSHYQGTTPNTWGIHKNNYGFVPSMKLGIGFQF